MERQAQTSLNGPCSLFFRRKNKLFKKKRDCTWNMRDSVAYLLCITFITHIKLNIMAFNKIKVYNKLVVNGKVTNDNDLTKSKIYITGGFHRSSKDLDETSRTELANLYRKWVLQENDIPVGDSPLDDIIGMSTADVRRKVKKAMFGDADQILGWGAWKQHDGTTKNTEALLMDYLHRNDFEYEILN